jgi:hypothetical protein
VATLLAATYPALVLLTGQAMSDLAFAAGVCALLAWLVAPPRGRRSAALTGLAVGVLTLLRTVGAGLAILPLLLADRGDRIRAFLVCACVAIATVLPWMVRNASEMGSFTIGTNGGANMLVGQHPGASGWSDAFELPPAVAAATGEVARDAAMRREALGFMREHPLEAIALVPAKFAAMYLLETQAVSAMFHGEKQAGDAMRYLLFGVSQFAWFVIAALVLVRLGSWRDPQRRPRGAQWIGWVLVAYFTAICVVFHGEDRYRLPLLPWLLIEAAVVLCGAPQPRRRSISPFNSSSDEN